MDEKTNSNQYINLLISCFVRAGFWIGIMILVKQQSTLDLAGKDDLWTIFFSIIGVVYAITIVFLLVIVLEKYNKFSSTILDEINLVQDIRDFLILIEVRVDIQKKIYKNLIRYVEYIYKKEWAEMINSRKSTKSIEIDTCKELYEIY